MGENNPNPMGNSEQNQTPQITVKVDRWFSTKEIIFGVLILLLLAYIAVSWFRDNAPTFDTRESIDSAILEHSVREIGELATLSYSYETIVVVDEQNTVDIFGIEFNVPGTARSLIITFEGRMRFGIDMDEVRITISEQDENMYNMRISLPNPTIQTHEIDMESILLLDERAGIFVSFDLEDYTHFIADRKEYVETRTSTQNLVSQARESAQRSIYIFLRNLLDEEYYDISFNWI